MYGPVKAIAIDDEPSHLLSVVTALGAIGIPATGFWYDRENSRLEPPAPENGHEHLRLIFTDLNLSELGGVPEISSLWATIVSVLKQLVSKDSGPYLLVFWTRIEANAAAVKQMLYDRAGSMDGVPLPLDVVEIAKGPLLVKPVEGDSFDEQLRSYFAELHGKMKEFKGVIEGSVNIDAQLRALAAWEARAAEAASRAVNEVVRCARIDVNDDPTQASKSIAVTLSNIAIAASGKESAMSHPAHALDAGMIDIATDQFGASVTDESYINIVGDSIAADVRESTLFARPQEMQSELNTFFHVDRSVSHVGPLDRGAVIYVKTMGAALGGFRPMKYLTSEFMFPAELVGEDVRSAHAGEIAEIRDSKSAVFVELGADCDHAQASSRTRRFLLGFCVPEKYMHLIRPSGGLRSGALELLGPWKIEGEVKYLLVSCRRFWTWQESKLEGVEVAFRLRSSVVEKLLHRYSTWNSRPGIVEFR